MTIDIQKPTLSVIIVSWNTKTLLSQCLASLESCRPHLELEVILVDNASSDGTVEMVRKQFPHVRLVQNETNVGFAKANNIGIELSSGNFICLVNSDVVVPKGCLERMVHYMEGHPGIGMLGPKMILPDGSVGQSCFRFPTVWNWLCNAVALDSLFKGSRVFGDFTMANIMDDKIQDVDVLTGWFWMVRKQAVAQVGVLDTRFFLYGEDIDWPKRFHQRGWRVVFYPEARAIHYCGASSSHAPARFYLEMNRANLQYFRKHHSLLAVVSFWIAMWLHQVVRIIGYCAVYVACPSSRKVADHKLRRSAACFLWLMGLRTVGKA